MDVRVLLHLTTITISQCSFRERRKRSRVCSDIEGQDSVFRKFNPRIQEASPFGIAALSCSSKSGHEEGLLHALGQQANTVYFALLVDLFVLGSSLRPQSKMMPSCLFDVAMTPPPMTSQKNTRKDLCKCQTCQNMHAPCKLRCPCLESQNVQVNMTCMSADLGQQTGSWSCKQNTFSNAQRALCILWGSLPHNSPS